VCVCGSEWLCVEGFKRCAGFFVAPVTRLSRSFMMRLTVSKAIIPFSNPTEKKREAASLMENNIRIKKQNRKKKYLLMHAALFVPPRLSQIKKHERKQKRREV